MVYFELYFINNYRTIIFQGNKFYIGLYSGTVTVINSLDYESVNNYTLRIIAKVCAFLINIHV